MLHCHVCYEDAGVVGFDDERNYFECAGKQIWHEWSELRNPTCIICDDPLRKHQDVVIVNGSTEFLCPSIPGVATFEWPEDTR